MVGIVGSDDKCAWVKKEVGYDEAVNYKSETFKQDLQKCVPNGVDCYFDNVSVGVISSLKLLKYFLMCHKP